MVALTDDWNFESSQNPTRFTSRNYCAKATECYIRDKVTTTKLASEVSQTLNLQNLSGFQAALVFMNAQRLLDTRVSCDLCTVN